MENKINEVLEKLEQLKENNVSHDELGQTMGFHEVEMIKNEISNYLNTLLNDYKQNLKAFPKNTTDKFIEKAKNTIVNLEGMINNIEKTIEKGVNQPEYPNRRSNIINQFKTYYDEVEGDFHIYESKLSFQKIKKLEMDHSGVSAKEGELNTLLKSVKEKEGEISKILGTVRDKMIAKGLEETAGTFDGLRKNHLDRENKWFVTSIIFSIILVVLLIVFFFHKNELGTTNALIVYYVKKIALISVTAIFLKISIKRNNLERNLRIIYDHRATVLEQYKIFEGAIGDDEAAKNQFRLEIAKYIFSDPDSGYNKDAKNENLNVSPIFQLADKFTS